MLTSHACFLPVATRNNDLQYAASPPLTDFEPRIAQREKERQSSTLQKQIFIHIDSLTRTHDIQNNDAMSVPGLVAWRYAWQARFLRGGIMMRCLYQAWWRVYQHTRKKPATRCKRLCSLSGACREQCPLMETPREGVVPPKILPVLFKLSPTVEA